MTQSTELQTVSMHIITGVALFFLPGTFVAVRLCCFPSTSSVSSASFATSAIAAQPSSSLASALEERPPLTGEQSIFDSNMLDFEPAPVRIMGHWKLNMGALSLFFYITLPMMVVTIALWGFLFWHVNRKRQKIQEKSVMVA